MSNTSILQRIDAQREQYMRLTGSAPKYVFIGFEDVADLDHACSQIVFKYKDMDIIQVQKPRFICCASKYPDELKENT